MKILIVEARYYGEVADALMDGATASLEKGGAEFSRASVPGVLELPTAIAIAAQKEEPFDGYVALGCVIGDGIAQDAIYRETVRGLMLLGLGGQVVGNGVVTARDEQGALALAQDSDAGGDAARACLALVTLRDRLDYL